MTSNETNATTKPTYQDPLPVVIFQGALVLFPVTKAAQLKLDGLDVDGIVIPELVGYEESVADLFRRLADAICPPKKSEEA